MTTADMLAQKMADDMIVLRLARFIGAGVEGAGGIYAANGLG